MTMKIRKGRVDDLSNRLVRCWNSSFPSPLPICTVLIGKREKKRESEKKKKKKKLFVRTRTPTARLIYRHRKTEFDSISRVYNSKTLYNYNTISESPPSFLLSPMETCTKLVCSLGTSLYRSHVTGNTAQSRSEAESSPLKNINQPCGRHNPSRKV